MDHHREPAEAKKTYASVETEALQCGTLYFKGNIDLQSPGAQL